MLSDTKKCARCGRVLPVSEFSLHRSSLRSNCKACRNIELREYWSSRPERVQEARRNRTESGRGREDQRRFWASKTDEERRALRRKYKSRRAPQPVNQLRAQGRLHAAVRSGRIKKPTTCETCGASGVVINAHHDDYSKPLDVKWLCSWCHRKLHAKTRAEGRHLRSIAQEGAE